MLFRQIGPVANEHRGGQLRLYGGQQRGAVSAEIGLVPRRLNVVAVPQQVKPFPAGFHHVLKD